jgi:hypothetical protein
MFALSRFVPAFAAAAVVVLSLASASSAYVSGSLPTSKNCTLQHKIAVKGGKTIAGVGKCYVKAGKGLCHGDDVQELLDKLNACKAKVRNKWISATDTIREKNPSVPVCLSGADTGQVFDDLDTVLQRAAYLVACEGVAPLIGELTGHTPSDCPSFGKAELKVLANVKGLARKLAFNCLHNLCVKKKNGKSFDLDACVDLAKEKFLTKTGKVKHVPQCLLDNAPVIADLLDALLSADAGVLFCESGPALDPTNGNGGCCQFDGSCAPANSPADCDVGFRSGETCNAEGSACVPPTCGITDHLACTAPADTCFTCGIDCCPAPFCGNGVCDAGEDPSNCSTDCPL